MLRMYIDESGVIAKRYNPHQRYFVLAYVLTKDCKKLHQRFKAARHITIQGAPSLMQELEMTNEVKGANVSEVRKADLYKDLCELT